MMRRENGRVFITLTLPDADRLCRLPREVLGQSAKASLFGTEKETVTFELTVDDFLKLLLALGRAAGEADRDRTDRDEFWEWIKLANAVNEGNPNWTPYAVDEPKHS